ncbi:MAG TPA: recombinase family protein, partial [Candidatus Saccharimonadales bacterium]|nr:recombinase family protein [Candidatus Saccharimonadales bacterium]
IPVKGKGASRVEGRLVINKEEAKVVRMVFDWIGNEGISLKEVIRRLFDMGIPPKKRKRLNWTSGPITRLARNESYTGRYFWFKAEAVVPKNPQAKTQKYQYRHTLKTSRRRKPKEEWLPLKIPRIIDDEIYERVQAQLDKNATFAKRNKKNPYLFGGLIYCPCGNKRTGEGQDKHLYYRCTARILEFPLPRSCFEAGINAHVLDVVGWQKLVELLTQPNLLEEQLKRFMEKQEADAKLTPSNEDTEARFKTLEEEERRYVQAWGVGNMSESVYLERMNSIASRRKDLQKELAKTREQGNLHKLKDVDLNAVAEPFKKFLGKLPYEDKLFTVRKIVDKVIATKEKVEICGSIPVLQPITESHVGLHANDRHRRFTKRR